MPNNNDSHLIMQLTPATTDMTEPEQQPLHEDLGNVLSPTANLKIIPPTDSGYATAPPEGCASAGTGDRDENKGRDDSGTVVSAETTAIGPEAQCLISEVCNNMYNQIQQYVNEDNQASVLDALPTLIKAFAVRLASRDPTPAGRRLMHFVYSRNM